MISVLHGENTVSSRNKLVELITLAKDRNKTIERLDAKNLNLGLLESKLIKQDLFGTEIIVVIEDLHSLPRSKNRTSLIELVSKSQVDVILWEKRTLTPAMRKKFPHADIFEFKLSSALFTWLDTLCGDGKNTKKQLLAFHKTLATEDPHLCFMMFTRQVRMLIQIQDGGVINGPPWMKNKLRKQSQTFNLNQLLTIHSQLLAMDLKQKTSTNTLELDQELDLLIMSL
ncbi:hypothetical protein KJ707_01995 [Patescibacteria group bacterium]|nr:hypothetical protein [Patescibacteria group bacterium]MBU1967178.1 hypothetical protein [Patescibacteria group bacterium]MBU2543312.1 hypothetical protein [Patescibacteria group bacterium]